jgi:hypothetical protein
MSLAATLAVARLTVLEAWRNRIGLIILLVGAGLVAILPNLASIDASARLKLAIVALGGVVTFLVVLFAALIGASGLRRDLDSRIAYTLFSKPMPVASYLAGRWVGVQAVVAATIVAVGLCGLAAIRATAQPPALVTVRDAVSWQRVSASGELMPIEENRSRTTLSGPVGNGVVWSFTGLPVGRDLALLVRIELAAFSPDEVIDQAAVRLDALGDKPVVLSAPGTTANTVVLRSRDEARQDLAQDYVRVAIPARAVGAGGSCRIRMTRLDPRTAITVHRADSAKVMIASGSFAANLARGGLIVAAMAGVLGAMALLCATVSNLGVSLLGTLTLYFAGAAMPMIRDVVGEGEAALPIRRLLGLSSMVLPDLARFDVAGTLAGSREIPWSAVGEAWWSYGGYAVVLLVIAWLSLARRELP